MRLAAAQLAVLGGRYTAAVKLSADAICLLDMVDGSACKLVKGCGDQLVLGSRNHCQMCAEQGHPGNMTEWLQDPL